MYTDVYGIANIKKCCCQVAKTFSRASPPWGPEEAPWGAAKSRTQARTAGQKGRQKGTCCSALHKGTTERPKRSVLRGASSEVLNHPRQRHHVGRDGADIDAPDRGALHPRGSSRGSACWYVGRRRNRKTPRLNCY